MGMWSTKVSREYDPAELMDRIDAMPMGWRHLVNKYGLQIVIAYRADDPEADEFDASKALAAWRRQRQDTWLAHDWITPAVKAGFMAAARKPWRRNRLRARPAGTY